MLLLRGETDTLPSLAWEQTPPPQKRGHHWRSTVQPKAAGPKKRKRVSSLFTFDNEFSKVGDPGAPGGLSNTAVKVLICSLGIVQLEGHHEAPVTQVLDGRRC